MRDQYKKYPKGAHFVDGELLNKFGDNLNAINMAMPNQLYEEQVKGKLNQTVPPPPFLQGIAVITDATDECPETEPREDGFTEQEAPCAKDDLYLCEFRYWDHAEAAWRHLHDIHLDASGYWEGHPPHSEVDPETGELKDPNAHRGRKPRSNNENLEYPTDASQSPTSGIGYGAIPKFEVGDVVIAYWDYKRKWLIPIHSPPQDTPRVIVDSDDATPVPLGCVCLTEIQNDANDDAAFSKFLTVDLTGAVGPADSLDPYGDPWGADDYGICDCLDDACADWGKRWVLEYAPQGVTDKDCVYALANDGMSDEAMESAGIVGARQEAFPCSSYGDTSYFKVEIKCEEAGVNNPYGLATNTPYLLFFLKIVIKGCEVAKWFFDNAETYAHLSVGTAIDATATKVCASPDSVFPTTEVECTAENPINEFRECGRKLPAIIEDDGVLESLDTTSTPNCGAGNPAPCYCYPRINADFPELVAFHDQHNCKWDAAALPVLELEIVGEQAEQALPLPVREDCVTFYIEIRTPGDSVWRSVANMHFPVLDIENCQTASTFGGFLAPHNTELRVTVALADGGDFQMAFRGVRLELEGVGRNHVDVRDTKGCLYDPPPNKVIKTDWRKCIEVKGRYKDSPTFVVPAADDNTGVFKITYEDPKDAWLIRVALTGLLEASLKVPPPPPFGEELSSSSLSSTSSKSTSSSLSSSSQSSQSQESWSSQSLSTSSSSSASSSSESTSSFSSSSSTSSQSNEFSLGDCPEEDYCCVEVVTNIECNIDGTIANVCKKVICFPRVDGCSCDEQIKPQECAVCDTEVSSESSPSSSSVSSSSSSASSSSESSSASSQSQESWSSQSSISSSSSVSSLSSQSQESWSSQSSVSSISSSSTSSLDQSCPPFELLDPDAASTPDAITSTPAVSIIIPKDSTAAQHWTEALLNNEVSIVVTSNNGAGTLTINQNNGTITYTPPADGSEANATITMEFEVCDAPSEPQLSESSLSSLSSSTTSLSSLSTSSLSSESSLSSLSSASSPSSEESSESSSSLSSSSISSSSVSSASSLSSQSSVSSTSSLSSSLSSFSSESTSSSSASSSSASSSSVSSSSVSSDISSLSSSSTSSTSSQSSSVSSLSSELSSASSLSSSSLSSSSLSSSSLSSSSTSSQSSSLSSLSSSSTSSQSSSLSSASSTSTSSQSQISSLSSPSTSSASSTSSISTSSESSSSSAGEGPCPDCVHCTSYEAIDCTVTLKFQNALNTGPGFNHSGFTDVSVAEDGEMKVELYGMLPNEITSQIQVEFRDTTIYFSGATNEAKAADLAAKVEAYLVSLFGGVWTVTAAPWPADPTKSYIINVESTNSTYKLADRSDALSFGQEGGAGQFSDHQLTTIGSYQDPYVVEAINQLVPRFTLTGTAACQWEVEIPLVTGSGTGMMIIALEVFAGSMAASIDIVDHEDQEVATADYSLTGSNWQCDRRYTMTKIADSSRNGPTAGGPLLADRYTTNPCLAGVADWCGETEAVLNDLELPPV